MKTIFKNFVFVLKRFKTSSILNILGLSAAFSVFIVLMIQVYYDFSSDRNFKDADEIYMFSSYSPFKDQQGFTVNTQMGDDISIKTSLIDAYTTVTHWGGMRFYKEGSSPDNAINESLMRVRGDFLKVFNPKVAAGSLSEGISEGDNIAISESVAKKLFGDVSPIGQVIISYDGEKTYTIRAVLEDFPENSSFKNGVFAYLPEDVREEWSYTLYFKIRPENRKAFVEYINSEEYFGEGIIQKMEDHPEQKIINSIIPLVDIHLKFPEKGNGSFNTTLALMAIAILTLVIAYINFINFTIAMTPARVKVLNIQRILGANKGKQTLIIAMESVIFSSIAFIIALLFINLIRSSFISELFSANISIEENLPLLCVFALLILLISFLFGLYPARRITNFNITESLQGTTSNNKQNSKLRSALIVFQFVATITLVIITISIKTQHDYMLNYSWGIEKENIVYIDLNGKGINYENFTDELLKNTHITDYTMSRFIPGNVGMGWGRSFGDKELSFVSWPVTDNFLQFFGASVVAGDNFPALNNPDKLKIIFNEELLRKYELDVEDVLGKEIGAFTGSATIIGIAKDINFQSLKMPITPMAFITLSSQNKGILFLKLSGNDIKGAVKLIEDIWPKYSKETLDLNFLDERLAKLYRNENNLAKLVSIFSFITILISIMGVYGLITFNTKYRMREIALRKVNGADEKSIILLINKNMLSLFLISFIIACPIAYLVVQKWLESFAYRSPIYWWIFPLAAVVVLLITIVSVSWQSYKAATTNPVNSLKSE